MGDRRGSRGDPRGLPASLLAALYLDLFPLVWWTLPLAVLVRLVRLVVRLVVRLARPPLRLVVRHPVPVTIVAGLVAWREWTGWVGLVLLLVAVVGLGAGWRYRWPDSFERQLVTRARSWWRWRRVYRRCWQEVMHGCGLAVTTPEGCRVPTVVAIRSRRDQDRLTLVLPPGAGPGHGVPGRSRPGPRSAGASRPRPGPGLRSGLDDRVPDRSDR